MRYLVAVSALVFGLSSTAAYGQSDLQVPLKFIPQNSVGPKSVPLSAAILDRHVEFVVEDGRSIDDLKVIGQGTDDDDRLFPIVTSVPVQEYVNSAVKQMVQAYGVRSANPGGRTIRVRVSRFNILEGNKAVGSTYAAEVHLAYTFESGGKQLMDGATSGSASRYGRARSAANISEVVSNALKEAFDNLLNDYRLQEAWKTGTASPRTTASPGAAAPSAAAPSAAPAAAPAAAGTQKKTLEQRLTELNELLKKGLITQEEYKVMRAEALKSGG
jgi:uncharacterized lipoprotein YajG